MASACRQTSTSASSSGTSASPTIPLASGIRGNGLGLYLVRGVVEAHGGTVWIESTGVPGEGTTVHLLLPWLPAAVQPR